MKYSLTAIIKQLTANDFHFKKRWGQNFIIDSNIINNIVREAHIDNNTLVIEIGTGAGALTQKLVEEAKQVISYEIDKYLEKILKDLFKDIDNIEIIFDDFLKRDIIKDIKKYSYDKLIIVANLPYYITTPIINKIIDEQLSIDSMVIMVQKEVAERLMAKPGSKDYNSLSVFIDYFFEIKKLFDIGRNVFVPKPDVDSIVIEMKKRKDKKVNIANESLFFKLIKDAFVFKRKNLKNNLKNYNINLIEKVLAEYNMDSKARAENISIEIFAHIANELNKHL